MIILCCEYRGDRLSFGVEQQYMVEIRLLVSTHLEKVVQIQQAWQVPYLLKNRIEAIYR